MCLVARWLSDVASPFHTHTFLASNASRRVLRSARPFALLRADAFNVVDTLMLKHEISIDQMVDPPSRPVKPTHDQFFNFASTLKWPIRFGSTSSTVTFMCFSSSYLHPFCRASSPGKEPPVSTPFSTPPTKTNAHTANQSRPMTDDDDGTRGEGMAVRGQRHARPATPCGRQTPNLESHGDDRWLMFSVNHHRTQPCWGLGVKMLHAGHPSASSWLGESRCRRDQGSISRWNFFRIF